MDSTEEPEYEADSSSVSSREDAMVIDENYEDDVEGVKDSTKEEPNNDVDENNDERNDDNEGKKDGSDVSDEEQNKDTDVEDKESNGNEGPDDESADEDNASGKDNSSGVENDESSGENNESGDENNESGDENNDSGDENNESDAEHNESDEEHKEGGEDNVTDVVDDETVDDKTEAVEDNDTENVADGKASVSAESDGDDEEIESADETMEAEQENDECDEANDDEGSVEEEDDGSVEMEDDEEDDDGSVEDDDESVEGDDDDGSEEGEDWETDENDDGEEEEDAEAGDETSQMFEAAQAAEESDSADDVESCPICLNKFRGQDVGTPESCDHNFCLDCIMEWANNVNTCPVDRQVFHLILAKHSDCESIYKRFPVEDKSKQESGEDEVEELTFCEVCHRCDREDRLLLCDGCDLGYHCECLDPPLESVPIEEWFCPDCIQIQNRDRTSARVSDGTDGATCEESEEDVIRHRPFASPRRRLIPRTQASERVRTRIQATRAAIARMFESEDEEMAAATTCSSSTISPRKPKTTRKKTKRKKRVYKKGRKSTKKVTGKKTTKTRRRRTVKGKGKKTRTRRKTRRRKRKVMKRPPVFIPAATPKARLAGKLGLSKPPVGRTIPMQKVAVEKTMEGQRAGVGISSLSIMGDRDELLSFNEGEDVQPSTSVPVESKKKVQPSTKYSMSAIRSHRPVARPRISRLLEPSTEDVATRDRVIEAPSTSGGPLDILGSIMQEQTMLTMKGRDITINRDGSLTAKRTIPDKTVKDDEEKDTMKSVKSQPTSQDADETGTDQSGKHTTSSENKVEPDLKGSLDSAPTHEKSDSEDVGRSPYTDSETDERQERNMLKSGGKKESKSETPEKGSEPDLERSVKSAVKNGRNAAGTRQSITLEHCNPEKPVHSESETELELGGNHEHEIPEEESSLKLKEKVLQTVEDEVRALYNAAGDVTYRQRGNIQETPFNEKESVSDAESLGENDGEVDDSVELDQANETFEGTPGETETTMIEKRSEEIFEKKSDRSERSISPVSYNRALSVESVESEESGEDGVCDSRPKVPISELPRIPKKKKLPKPIEIITIEDDEEEEDKGQSVLQRLDSPENRSSYSVWQKKDRREKKDGGKSSSKSEGESRDRSKGSSRSDRRREVSDEDKRGHPSHADRRRVMLNERGGLIVRTEDPSYPESTSGHSHKKRSHSGEGSRSKSKDRSRDNRDRSRSRERRDGRDRVKSKEESQRSRSRDRSRKKRRHDRSRSGSRSDHDRHERSHRRRKKKRDRSVEDATHSDRRSYDEEDETEYVPRRGKTDPRSSKGDAKEKADHREKGLTKDRTTSWEEIDSKDKNVSRDKRDLRNNKGDARKDKHQTPKEKIDLREKLDSRNKGDLREKLDNRLKGDLREKIDSRLKMDSSLRDKIDLKVKSDVKDVRHVEERRRSDDDAGWHGGEMLTGYKRSFGIEIDSIDTKRRKEETTESESKKKSDPSWISEHSAKMEQKSSVLSGRASSIVARTSPSVQFNKEITPVKSTETSPQENIAASPCDLEHSNSNSPVCPAQTMECDPITAAVTKAASVSPSEVPVRSQPLLPTPLAFLKLQGNSSPRATQMMGGINPQQVDSLYDPAMPTDTVSPPRELAMKGAEEIRLDMNSLGMDLVQRQELMFKGERLHSPNTPGLLGEGGFLLQGEHGMINVLQPHQNLPIQMTLGLLPPGFPPGLHGVPPRPHLVMNPLLLNRPPPFTRIPQVPGPLPPRFSWPGHPQGVIPIPNQDPNIIAMQNRFPTGFPPPSAPPTTQQNLINGGFDPMHPEAGIRRPFPPIFHTREDPRQALLPPPNIRVPPPDSMERPPEPTTSAPTSGHATNDVNPLNEISKLLNIQAQLVGGLKKRDRSPDSAGKDFFMGKPGKGNFKVPLPPAPGSFGGTSNKNSSGSNAGGMKPSSGNLQGSSNETTEVVDMDMSPLEDDANIIVSPEYDKDDKDDKVSDIVFLATRPDDVPSSAVELTNKDKAGKYMRKLHLQERVVEEVKLAIKPFYSKKRIDKEEYKDILRKSVPKICHSKSGDINPAKIQSLIEAYVEKAERAKEKKPPSKANGERRPKVSR